MKKYKAPTLKRVNELAALASELVKNLVEFELGPVPLDAMNEELKDKILDWIEEVDSEQCLAYKLDTGFFD